MIIPTLAQEGIEIELVKFSDYIIPNQALANGDVDLNAFQHYDFMEQWSEDYGVELVAVCDTLIAPSWRPSRTSWKTPRTCSSARWKPR